ncbi:hypothetical protein CU097_010756 [Rhizopus azygosporus]|uniref:Pentacotripeptide-repeat region of PRORP domain-containing protein n=2 Tax=Rhizopus TaxID=4842 RepID=A0A367JR19_RHIAZ|nr:hypothetical protein CU097_010756 [Rhizopus azygosporus]
MIKHQIFFQKGSLACKQAMRTSFPLFTLRLASTATIVHNNSKSKSNEGNKRSRPVFVKVDSPFAKANKFTYVMPADPYVASNKITTILKNGTLNDAADYIKALPLDLQTAAVWNQLIGYCAQHGKANSAEQYYVQMRKRGISPNERTFTHLLSAYANSTSPQAIERAERRFTEMKKFDMSPSVIHINNLLRVYNHAGQPSKTVELLHDMLVRGMSPDATTYSIALRACSELENTHQARQEVRSIWKQIVNRLQPASNDSSDNAPKQPPVEIDDTLVTSLLIAISRTSSQEADITAGIDIVRKLYSLYPVGAASMVNKYALSNKSESYGFGMQPSPKVLDAILRLCGKFRQYALGMEYYELALQQFPRLKPDQHVKKSHMWLKKQERKRLYEMKKKER